MRETQVQSLGWEDPLEKAMATRSSILAYRIPWTEEPGGLQSMESQRVRHDWACPLPHLLCTVVWASAVQWGESATHTLTSPPFWILFPFTDVFLFVMAGEFHTLLPWHLDFFSQISGKKCFQSARVQLQQPGSQPEEMHGVSDDVSSDS